MLSISYIRVFILSDFECIFLSPTNYAEMSAASESRQQPSSSTFFVFLFVFVYDFFCWFFKRSVFRNFYLSRYYTTFKIYFLPLKIQILINFKLKLLLLLCSLCHKEFKATILVNNNNTITSERSIFARYETNFESWGVCRLQDGI